MVTLTRYLQVIANRINTHGYKVSLSKIMLEDFTRGQTTEEIYYLCWVLNSIFMHLNYSGLSQDWRSRSSELFTLQTSQQSPQQSTIGIYIYIQFLADIFQNFCYKTKNISMSSKHTGTTRDTEDNTCIRIISLQKEEKQRNRNPPRYPFVSSVFHVYTVHNNVHSERKYPSFNTNNKNTTYLVFLSNFS